MRLSPRLEPCRVLSGDYRSRPGEPFGAFIIQGPCGEKLKILASDGDDEFQWEHVSVSKGRHPPNWAEMCFVKDLFWAPEECVVQYHPPHSDYVNNHANCLHLWRPRDGQVPRPPSILVGDKEAGEIKSKADADAIRRAAGIR
jgi:hypothetical protein